MGVIKGDYVGVDGFLGFCLYQGFKTPVFYTKYLINYCNAFSFGLALARRVLSKLKKPLFYLRQQGISLLRSRSSK